MKRSLKKTAGLGVGHRKISRTLVVLLVRSRRLYWTYDMYTSTRATAERAPLFSSSSEAYYLRSSMPFLNPKNIFLSELLIHSDERNAWPRHTKTIVCETKIMTFYTILGEGPRHSSQNKWPKSATNLYRRTRASTLQKKNVDFFSTETGFTPGL